MNDLLGHESYELAWFRLTDNRPPVPKRFDGAFEHAEDRQSRAVRLALDALSTDVGFDAWQKVRAHSLASGEAAPSLISAALDTYGTVVPAAPGHAEKGPTQRDRAQFRAAIRDLLGEPRELRHALDQWDSVSDVIRTLLIAVELSSRGRDYL